MRRQRRCQLTNIVAKNAGILFSDEAQVSRTVSNISKSTQKIFIE